MLELGLSVHHGLPNQLKYSFNPVVTYTYEYEGEKMATVLLRLSHHKKRT